MNKLSQLCIAILCLVCFQNCDSDDFDTRAIPNPQTQEDILRDEMFIAENFGALTTGNFFGTVEDQYGVKLTNVNITIGNTTSLTDRNGIFSIKNATVYEKFAYIKASKEGYIDGSRTVIPNGETNRVKIILFKKEIIASVNSGEFSTVSLPNGTKVNFTGGFVRQDGTTYNGQVDVVLHHIGQNPIQTFDQMPGSLFGQTEENQAVGLETYGMMSVNLFSPSGERININELNRATLEFPIMNDNAPDFIPLWYFDEERGYWKEEGQAVKFGNIYVGEVAHFTWWNIDIDFESVEFCFTLASGNTTNNAPYYVLIQPANSNAMVYAGLNTSYIQECAQIPINEEIRVSVFGGIDSEACNTALIHEEILGGFGSDTSVTIAFQEQFTTTSISGMATNCNGNPITNGYIYLNNTNTFSITNGMIDIDVLTCATIIENLDIQLYDLDTGQWTILENIQMDGNPIHIGNLSTCTDSGGVFNGDLILSSQSEVDNFSAIQFSSISGNLIIGDPNVNPDAATTTDITDISGLSSIQNISGRLEIKFNNNLQNLQGLEQITEVTNLIIRENTSITSLNGLNGLTSIQYLEISGNDQLSSISQLGNLSSLGNTRIINNPVLASLNGLENITSLGGIILGNNPMINGLQPLSNLTELVELHINNCHAITSLQGMEQITEIRYLFIYNNNGLTSLNGLQNLTNLLPTSLPSIVIGSRLTDVGSYVPSPNSNLSDFCALQNVFINGNGTSADVHIENNAYNPTPQDITAGNCSQ
ncbi:leucine-rich repeat domain-containing protein [Kordia zhangzhouensis]|uniref:hypothetical protein n=1 Tax=Kordia zhangzhouensis TaxID=1620405 RepID=UPI0012E06800|nr:hypothetical protein [Kordia zhangzhouensis]